MRRVRGLPTAAVLAGLLGGCWWSVPGQGPDRQAHNRAEDQISPANVNELVVAWEASVDVGAAGDPVTSVGGVHVYDGRNVYGFDSVTGDRDWVYEPAVGTVMEQPLVHGDQIEVGTFTFGRTSGTGPTIALDTATGTEVGTISPDEVLVTDRGNRALYWTRGHFVPELPGFWTAQVRVKNVDTGVWLCCNNLAFAGAADETRPVQLTLGPGDLFFDAGYGLTDPDIDNIGNGVRGYSISAPRPCPFVAQGQCPQWAIPLQGSTSTVPVLSSDGATLYVGTDSGLLYSVNSATGAINWSADLGTGISAAPALADGFLYVPAADGRLYVLDAAGCGASTCFSLWTGDTGSRVTQQPAVAGGVVFTGSAIGRVTAFDAAGCGISTCLQLWGPTAGSEITGAPAVSGGQLYVGTADGRVVAYRLGGS